MQKYHMADQVPGWLVRLKPGQYTIEEIQKITDASRPNIFMRLETLGVQKERKKLEGHWKNVYFWKGASYYWLRVYEKKQQSLEKEGDS